MLSFLGVDFPFGKEGFAVGSLLSLGAENLRKYPNWFDLWEGTLGPSNGRV